MTSFRKVLQGLPTEVSLNYASYKPGKPKKGQLAFEAEPKEVVVVLNFSEAGFGFGQVGIKQTTAGVFLDTEHMGKEQVKKYLCALVDKAVTDVDMDLRRHAQYCKAMGRRCGPACPVCGVKRMGCRDINTCGGDCEGCQLARLADELGD